MRPLVVTVMGGDVQPEQHLAGLPALERRATRRLLEEADLILAKSDALRTEIAAFGRFESKIETVRWGVDPELFRARPEEAAALRARLGLAAGDRVVLSPRLLRPLYNVHLLVEAMPRVLAAVPGALLLLSRHRADEDYERTLRARVDALGLGGTRPLRPAHRSRRDARLVHAGRGVGEPALLRRAAAVDVRGDGVRDGVASGSAALLRRGGDGRRRTCCSRISPRMRSAQRSCAS